MKFDHSRNFFPADVESNFNTLGSKLNFYCKGSFPMLLLVLILIDNVP